MTDTLKEIERVLSECEYTYMSGFNVAKVKRAIRLAREGGWIRVEDRLPTDGVDVLYYLPEYKRSEVGDYFRKWDSFGGVKRSARDVSHWQPLPEPPEDK